MFITRPAAAQVQPITRLSKGGMGSPVTLTGVTDGLSNTPMIGEAEPDPLLATYCFDGREQTGMPARKITGPCGGGRFRLLGR